MPAFCLLLVLGSFALGSAETAPSRIPQNIQALLDAREYPPAEEAIQRELERAPTWDVGHLLLAQIYALGGHNDLAERSALSAVRLRESLDGFMLLALVTQRLNRLNESIEWLDKAAQRQPNYPEIYRLLGINYALGGVLKESEKAFRRATELDSRNWEAHYFLGRTLYELDDVKGSQQALQRALEQNPSSPKIWTALGQVQEKLHDAPAAQASYQKALEMCGPRITESAWPLLQMGFLSERQKGLREAEGFFRRSAAARPDWAKPHFYLGKALAALNDLEGARAEMEIAVRLDEARSQHHYQLAQLYRRLKEPEKAKQHLARYQTLSKLERKQKAAVDLSSE